MKNILLIGDSIRIGYDKAVQKSLQGIANVYYPDENCRFAAYTLRNLHEYKKLLGNEAVNLIHWNAGLWDCLRLFEEEPHTPIDVYAYYIERICIRINKLFPEAKVIFATCTRVQSEKMAVDFKRYNEEIEKYNEAALAVVRKYGFAINDLYAVSASLPEEAHSDAVHYYTSIGTEAYTKAVLSHLCAALEITDPIPYREALYVKPPVGI